jgi:hypothetical protein
MIRRQILVAFALLTLSAASTQAEAGVAFGEEIDAWSDMAFPTGVSGEYSTSSGALKLTASPSNALELGAEFGPSNPGNHYGSGTAGGKFVAKLNLTEVVIGPDGSVISPGSFNVLLAYSVAEGLGDDYGILPTTWNTLPAALLLGEVRDVMFNTITATFDVVISLTGGALQNPPASLGLPKFSITDTAVLRLKGAGITSSSYSGTGFNFSGATLDVLGVPEPFSIFVFAGMVLTGCLCRTRHAVDLV